MTSQGKFIPLRKGLLEFLILSIVSSSKVYTADILQRLSGHPVMFRLNEDASDVL
jgi:hypothetical protein